MTAGASPGRPGGPGSRRGEAETSAETTQPLPVLGPGGLPSTPPPPVPAGMPPPPRSFGRPQGAFPPPAGPPPTPPGGPFSGPYVGPPAGPFPGPATPAPPATAQAGGGPGDRSTAHLPTGAPDAARQAANRAGGAGPRADPWRRRIARFVSATPVRAETPAGPRSFRVGQVALVAVLAGLVALAFATLFTGGPTGRAGLALLPAVAVAAALGCVTAARWPGWLVGLAGLAGAVLFSFLTLFADRIGRGSRVADQYATAARDGWAWLLTVGLPAEPSRELLLTPVLVLWAVAFAGAVLTVRTDAVLAPLLPAILGYMAALLVVSAEGRSLLLLTGLIALTALSVAVVRASRLATEGQISAVALRPASPVAEGGSAAGDEAGPGAAGTDSPAGRTGRRRLRQPAGRLALGLPFAGLIALVGTLAAVLLPVADGTGRFDPRDHRHPPVNVASSLNPLVQIKADHGASSRTLFTVRLSAVGGKVATDRIRTVTLADFDGASWRNDGAFVRSGRTFPAGVGAAPVSGTPAAGIETRLEVTVDAAGGPFLPSLGEPVSITNVNFDHAFEPAGGVLATTTSAQAGEHYRLTARVPAPSAQQLRDAVPVSGPVAAPYRQLPLGLPPELQAVARTVMGPKSSPFEQLTALTDYLRDPTAFPIDLDARPGHSYGALKRFLTGSKADHHGYVEQFAAAFALLARVEGFPTRIAVGYLLDARSSPRPGEFTVTSKYAFAWPEVALDGLGWVAFDPTDIVRIGSRQPPAGDDTPSGGEGPATAQAQTVPPIVRPELDRQGEPGAGGGGSGGNLWVFALMVILAGLAAATLGILAEKRRRRWRRHRAGPPAARVSGAWREVLDRLAERGVGPSRALTGGEVVERTRTVRGDGAGQRVDALVSVVSTALFAAAEPGEPEARHAWELAQAAARELHRTDTLPRRVAAAVDPRPLLVRR